MKKFRKNIKRLFPVILLLMVASLLLARVFRPKDGMPTPEATINAAVAVHHAGKVMEVCGRVESADYVTQVGGQPTFLNFGRPHPDQIFTAVIWGEDRLKWSVLPESHYLHREICVTGRIEMHRGIPQIRVRDPQQVREK